MFDQAVVGITRTDPNGVLVDVNEKKFCEMLAIRGTSWSAGITGHYPS